jgi:hypothetical protein
VSIDPALDEAVDCIMKLHDANPHATIDAIRSKVRDCAARYEVRFAGGGGYGIAEARKRLAGAFIGQVRDTNLSLDISEEITDPMR